PQAGLIRLPPAALAPLSKLLRAYVSIGDSMAANNLQGIQSASNEIAASLDEVTANPPSDSPGFWEKSSQSVVIRSKALQLTKVDDLEAARVLYASLSHPLMELIQKTGVPTSYGESIESLTCPMYPPKVGGAVWLQPVGEPRNPYLGLEMLRCASDSVVMPTSNEGSQVATSSPEVNELVKAYLELRQSLANDQSEALSEQFAALGLQAQRLTQSHDGETKRLAQTIVESSHDKPKDLKSARDAFQPISAAMIKLVKITSPTSEISDKLYVAYCPMAEASWIQKTAEISNPFMGQKMLTCGEVTDEIPLQ
ncbi:MAG: DUF3347 domain-containing protein, partial [Aureliella sp.]